MRRLRQPAKPIEVSLFPFLAVLICTLGVLIVMLVVAARQADQTAKNRQQSLDQQVAKETEDLSFEIKRSEAIIRSIKKARKDVLNRLEQARSNRSHLRTELKRLEKEVQENRQELVNANEMLLASDTQLKKSSKLPQNQSDLDALKSDIDDARSRLEQSRTAMEKGKQKRVVIAPYRGSGGTFRRPIFVECRSEQLVLQPFNVVLKKNEFDLPINSGNMLDAALLTVREYWQKHHLEGDHGQAYPLLVVRPDGAETFVLARRAMKSWDDEFGYELIESETQVDFGDVDEALEAEIRRSVDLARQRQMAMRRHRPQRKVRSRGNARSSLVEGGGRARAAARNGGSPIASGTPLSKDYGFSVAGAQAIKDLKQRMKSAQEMGPTPNFQRPNHSTEQPTNDTNVKLASSQTPTSSSKLQATSATSSISKAPDPKGTGGNQNAGSGSPFVDLSLVSERGSSWALPSRTPGSVGYVRPIRVVCRKDRWDLIDATTTRSIRVDSSDDVIAIDQLIDQIWKMMDSWGTAGSGNHWKPQLRVTVAEGGLGSFKILQGRLVDSGVTVQRATPMQPKGGAK